MSRKYHSTCVLLIGGSDAGGGAGIQADLRVMASYRLAGACAITGATAQNPALVDSLNLLRPAQVARQIEVVLDEIEISAVKIGMLGSLAIARAVAASLQRCQAPIVLDPVLVASSGGELLSRNGLKWLRDHMLPRCHVLTPNLPEASALLGRPIESMDDRRLAATHLRQLGADSVLIKGGHAAGTALIDWFEDERGALALSARRRRMQTHGTGCTFASAIAAELALGTPTRTAVERAHNYLQRALAHPLRLGKAGVCSPGLAPAAPPL